jgi:hypothetical protein
VTSSKPKNFCIRRSVVAARGQVWIGPRPQPIAKTRADARLCGSNRISLSDDGVGHVLASGAVALDTDTCGVDVQWSENATADSFGKNLVFAWCESRYATSVFSPLGVVSLDLTS